MDRNKLLQQTSLLGIIINLVLAVIKVLLGLFTKSMAIISEGINNATDIFSSLLALIGSKLANKHPDEKHPFGYGRIEYLTSLAISVIVLVTGIEVLISSVKAIFNKPTLNVSYISLIVIAISAIVKYVYGAYAVSVGKKIESGALIGVGQDSKNDTFLSVITIVSSTVFIIAKINIDAYAGIIISIVILKAGIGILLDTMSELIGRPGKYELAQKIYKKVFDCDIILNAADMMLHNYGPDQYSGSVNIEIDHEKSVGEIYEKIHKLQVDIMHEDKVTMVFGIYAVDNDHEETKKIRTYVANFVKENEHIKNFHAIYLEPHTKNIYCDLVVDYKLKEWDDLKKKFIDYMKKFYSDNNIILTIETEFV